MRLSTVGATLMCRGSIPLIILACSCLLTATCTSEPADAEAETESGDGDADADGGDGDGDAGDGDGDGDGDGNPGDGDGEAQPCPGGTVPQGEADLTGWLEGRGYSGWVAESGVHGSTGPHFGGVRTFVDSCLADSLDTGATEHPPGAAAIKELYGDGDQILGWSVMRKVAPGSGGDSWYWFEVYNGAVYADDVGNNLCTGCHSSGTDYFLSPWPLQ